MTIMCIFPDFFFSGLHHLATPANFFSGCMDLFKSLWNSTNSSVIYTVKGERRCKYFNLVEKGKKYTIGVECGRIHGSPFSKAG